MFSSSPCPCQGIQSVGTWQKLQLFYHRILENGGKSLISLHNQIVHSYNLQHFSWTVFSSWANFSASLFPLLAQTRELTAGRWSTLLCQSAVSSCATWLWYGWGQRWWPRGNHSTSKLFWLFTILSWLACQRICSMRYCLCFPTTPKVWQYVFFYLYMLMYFVSVSI